MGRKSRFTDEQVEAAVVGSLSFSEVCRKLGIRQNGNTNTALKKRVLRLGLDTTHFLGRRVNSSHRYKGGPVRLQAGDILQRWPGPKRRNGKILHRALREIGRPYRCQECGEEPWWRGQPLVLEVDHVDGDFCNNASENLRFLCPNCHSQTPTYRGRKTGRK